MKNLCSKRRDISDPYLTWTLPNGGTCSLLKAYQANHAKPYGRWHIVVQHGLSDVRGDAYVAALLPGLVKAAVAGKVNWDHGVWPTRDDLLVWLKPCYRPAEGRVYDLAHRVEAK